MGLDQTETAAGGKNRFRSVRLKLALKLKSLWLVVLGYFLLTSLFTYPLIFNFSTGLPGMLVEDRDQNLWNLWWVPRTLLQFKNPFHTDYIYYPEGVSLYFHTLHPLNGLLSYPVQLLFGLTAAYNFIVFFSFIMAGLGSYLLLRYLCQNQAVAFAASLIFTYAPYHIGTLKGLMQLISLEWLPFYLLFLLKATRSRERFKLNVGLAAFFLVCTALTDWYYVLFLLGFTGLYLVYPHEKPYFPALKRRFLIIGLIVGLFGLVISPILFPMIRELGTTNYYLPNKNAAQEFSATLAAFFIPPTTSTLLGNFAQNFQAEYLTGPVAAQVYLGYIALILGVVGLFTFRVARFWGVVLLVFWLLAFGPTLQLNGPEPGWTMPFGLIQNWPIVKITRSPDRFIVITMLALSVCAAFGLIWLHGLASRLKLPKKWDWLVAGLAGLLITLEFLQIPYPINSITSNPFFEQLGREEADYSLIELPAQDGFWSGASRMANQTIHHKRSFNGYISREYDHPFVRLTPGFQELALLKDRPDIFRPTKAQGDLPGERDWYDAFSYYKARYIILYLPQNQKERDTTDLAKNRLMIAQVVGEVKPIYKDELMEVYPMPSLSAADLHPFARIGEGWYEPEPDETGDGRHRWSAGAANLDLLWQGEETLDTHVSFNIGLLREKTGLRLTLDGILVWEGTVTTAQQTLQLELKLTPGQHRLDFYPEGTAQSPQALGIGNDPRKLLFYINNLAVE